MVKSLEGKGCEECWGLLVCSAQSREGWGEAAWQPMGFSEAGVEGQRWSLSGDRDRTRGNSMELWNRRLRLDIMKRFFTRVVGHWSRLPKAVLMAPKCWVQEACGRHLQTYGLTFGWCCVEPRAGLDDPYGSLPTWNILWFCMLHRRMWIV